MATASSLSVDKGVPIPSGTVRQGVNMELLKSLGTGDSVWWKEADAKKATRFYRVAQKLGLKIVIRKVGSDDPKGKGVRMWRIGEASGGNGAADPFYAAAKAADKAAPKKKPAAKPKAKPKAKSKAKAKKQARPAA